MLLHRVDPEAGILAEYRINRIGVQTVFDGSLDHQVLVVWGPYSGYQRQKTWSFETANAAIRFIRNQVRIRLKRSYRPVAAQDIPEYLAPLCKDINSIPENRIKTAYEYKLRLENRGKLARLDDLPVLPGMEDFQPDQDGQWCIFGTGDLLMNTKMAPPKTNPIPNKVYSPRIESVSQLGFAF